MKSNPLTIAANAKGAFSLVKRTRSITRRYGLTQAQMERALGRYVQALERFGCAATFPITAVALARHTQTVAKYLDANIEFAVHGYTHVDYAQLAPPEQAAHLERACRVFMEAGIVPLGFRSPYLRRDPALYQAIQAAGFLYASNQPLLWDIRKNGAAPALPAAYQRAIAFYEPWLAGERLSLPRLEGGLVEIPIALPDDEMLVDRLEAADGLIGSAWRSIFMKTHDRGELFVLQLHPERVALCANGLEAVLRDAQALASSVWCARLAEIAAWWKARARASIEAAHAPDGACLCDITAPSKAVVLARAVDVDASTQPWAGGYRRVDARRFTVKAPARPFVGVSPNAPAALAHFLRQQGYFVEISAEAGRYPCYFDQAGFDASQEGQVLERIESSGCPLVRLGRWPGGAQSALAVTGDIDALTLWDYGLRLVGK